MYLAITAGLGNSSRPVPVIQRGGKKGRHGVRYDQHARTRHSLLTQLEDQRSNVVTGRIVLAVSLIPLLGYWAGNEFC